MIHNTRSSQNGSCFAFFCTPDRMSTSSEHQRWQMCISSKLSVHSTPLTDVIDRSTTPSTRTGRQAARRPAFFDPDRSTRLLRSVERSTYSKVAGGFSVALLPVAACIAWHISASKGTHRNHNPTASINQSNGAAISGLGHQICLSILP